ncbi:MAG: ATP-binding protein [Solirubrobacteraceae bacterium]|nr:ATP-binding protein [Solirubrobacteraceae bacterium]
MAPGDPNRLDVTLPATAASLAAIRHAVVDFARDRDLPDPRAIGLAVTEAATNVILHAYPGGAPGEIRVVACDEPDRLVVVVRDWGVGMRPRTDSPGMGLGLPTIATLASAFDVEAAEGAGTLLRMHFARGQAQAVA